MHNQTNIKNVANSMSEASQNLGLLNMPNIVGLNLFLVWGSPLGIINKSLSTSSRVNTSKMVKMNFHPKNA